MEHPKNERKAMICRGARKRPKKREKNAAGII
jgi:hypothetical protein